MLRGGAGIGVGPYEPGGVSISPQGRGAISSPEGRRSGNTTPSPSFNRARELVSPSSHHANLMRQRTNSFTDDEAKFANGETLTIDMMASLRPWNRSTLDSMEA